MDETGLIISKKRANKISFKRIKKKFWLFSKPSWGELSFRAYGLLTFEFHNELYGWIQEKTKNWNETSIDSYFQQQGIQNNKSWTRLNGNESQKIDNRTIMTYIRNFTHHPENTLNQKYSEKELRQSISAMVKIAKSLK